MPVPVVPSYGRIVVLKRTGQDSASFDLTDSTYLFGRGTHCDIRIQLTTISEEHCRVFRDTNGKAVVENISAQGTIVNGNTLYKNETHVLRNEDILTVVERSFRYELDDPVALQPQLAATPLRLPPPPEADMIQFTPNRVRTLPQTLTLSNLSENSSSSETTDGRIGHIKVETESAAVVVVSPAKLISPNKSKALNDSNTLDCGPRNKLKTESPGKVITTPLSPKEPIKKMTQEKLESSQGHHDSPTCSTELTPKKVPVFKKETATPEKISTPQKTLTFNPSTPLRSAASSFKITTPTKDSPWREKSISATPEYPNVKPITAVPFPEEEVLALVNAFVPDSAKKTPLRLGNPIKTFVVTEIHSEGKEMMSDGMTSEMLPTNVNSANLATPDKQLTGALAAQGSVSKFEVIEMVKTPSNNPQTPKGAQSPSLEKDKVLEVNTPTPNLLSTPPPRYSTITPNINILFPPTPALAAASRLAESISAAEALGSSPVTSVHAGPSGVLVTPHIEKIMATPRSPRSPRYSVASAGSPVVVDPEITASPKLERIDFFDEPESNIIMPKQVLEDDNSKEEYLAPIGSSQETNLFVKEATEGQQHLRDAQENSAFTQAMIRNNNEPVIEDFEMVEAPENYSPTTEKVSPMIIDMGADIIDGTMPELAPPAESILETEFSNSLEPSLATQADYGKPVAVKLEPEPEEEGSETFSKASNNAPFASPSSNDYNNSETMEKNNVVDMIGTTQADEKSEPLVERATDMEPLAKTIIQETKEPGTHSTTTDGDDDKLEDVQDQIAESKASQQTEPENSKVKMQDIPTNNIETQDQHYGLEVEQKSSDSNSSAPSTPRRSMRRGITTSTPVSVPKPTVTIQSEGKKGQRVEKVSSSQVKKKVSSSPKSVPRPKQPVKTLTPAKGVTTLKAKTPGTTSTTATSASASARQSKSTGKVERVRKIPEKEEKQIPKESVGRRSARKDAPLSKKKVTTTTTTNTPATATKVIAKDNSTLKKKTPLIKSSSGRKITNTNFLGDVRVDLGNDSETDDGSTHASPLYNRRPSKSKGKSSSSSFADIENSNPNETVAKAKHTPAKRDAAEVVVNSPEGESRRRSIRARSTPAKTDR